MRWFFPLKSLRGPTFFISKKSRQTFLLRYPNFLRWLTPDACKFDRGHSLTSLIPPQAALGSFPVKNQWFLNFLFAAMLRRNELDSAARMNTDFIAGTNMTAVASYCCRKRWNGRSDNSYILNNGAAERVRSTGSSSFRLSFIPAIATRGGIFLPFSCLYAPRKF